MKPVGWLVAGTAAVGVAAVGWSNLGSPASSESVVESTPPRVAPLSKGDAARTTTEASDGRERLGLATVDPFVLWTPPVAKAPVRKVLAPPPPPPPPPTAPPFPYRVFGKLTDPEGNRVTYLMRDNRLVAVENDTELDGGFKVETVSESSVVVIYLPLGERTTLRLPEAAR